MSVATNGKLERSTDGTTFTEVTGNVLSVTVPEPDVDYKQNTSINPEGNFHTYKPGLKEPGESSFVIEFEHAAYAEAVADETTGLPIFYRYTLTEGATVDWQGYPRPHITKTETGELEEFTVAVKNTGPVTVAAGA